MFSDAKGHLLNGITSVRSTTPKYVAEDRFLVCLCVRARAYVLWKDLEEVTGKHILILYKNLLVHVQQ